MKRILYVVLVLVQTLLVACTEQIIDPTPQVPESRSYIFFEPKVIGTIESKAALVEGDRLPSENGTAFGVLGYYGQNNTSIFAGYFDGIAEVYRDGQVFKYDKLAPWFGADIDHHFYAFYPYDLYEAVTSEGDIYIEYTQPLSEDEMRDIMTAAKSQTKASGSQVKLEFHHRLCALDFELENKQQKQNSYTSNNNLYVVSAKLVLTNIPQSGKIFISTEGEDYEINSTNEQEDRISKVEYVLHSGDAILIEHSKKCSVGTVLLFPTQTTLNTATKVQYRIDLVLKNAWGVQYEFSYPPIFETALDEGTDMEPEYTYADFAIQQFKSGNRYKLIVSKTDGEDFDLSFGVESWDTIDVDHTFN